MKKPSLKITFVGDIMLGFHPVLYGKGVKSTLVKKSINPFSKIKNNLSDSDLVVGNLEAILSMVNYKKMNLKSGSLRGSPSMVSYFDSFKNTILSVANNHAMEHGSEAFFDNIDLLKKAKIKVMGEKNTDTIKPLIIEYENKNIGFLAFSTIPHSNIDNAQYWFIENLDAINNQVASIKKNVDFLIVFLHWGNEFVTFPSTQQISEAHHLIDAGTDLIVGHHSHIPQIIEKYQGKIIAYSLGNFVFDMWQDRFKDSLVLQVNINLETMKYTVSAIKAKIGENYQPYLTQDSVNPVNDISLYLLDEISYRNKVQKERKRYRRELYIHLLKNFYKYNPIILLQLIYSFLRKFLK